MYSYYLISIQNESFKSRKNVAFENLYFHLKKRFFNGLFYLHSVNLCESIVGIDKCLVKVDKILKNPYFAKRAKAFFLLHAAFKVIELILTTFLIIFRGLFKSKWVLRVQGRITNDIVQFIIYILKIIVK